MATLHELVPQQQQQQLKPSSGGECKNAEEPAQPSYTKTNKALSCEFSDSRAPGSSLTDSLSSASSSQSLASTLSSKSSSGICADSPPGSPDKSYVNLDIPELDDLISACANINLGNNTLVIESCKDYSSSSGENSRDQTFASAADDTIADETANSLDTVVEQTIQTFNTCPKLEPPRAADEATSSTADAFKAPLPVATSALIPYLSFEESVLKRQKSDEEELDEFKSALNSLQEPSSPLRRAHSPTPCEEIEAATLVKDEVTDKADNEQLSKEHTVYRSAKDIESPDVSFQEVETFGATVAVTFGASSLEELSNSTVSKEDRVNGAQASPQQVDEDIVQEANNNSIATQDIANDSSGAREIAQNAKNLSQLQGDVNLNDVTQDRNTDHSQACIKLEPEEEEDCASVNNAKEFAEKRNASIRGDRSPIKAEQDQATSEHSDTFVGEPNQSNLLNADVIASTPLPSKSISKEEAFKSPRRKSALFAQEAKSPPSKDKETKEEENNKINDLDQTVAVNKTFDRSSFTASELVSKDNIEQVVNGCSRDDSLNILPPQETEYEAFKPQQQSTTLPFPAPLDLEALQEAARSVAKDIDESIEKIEETEQFVSATADIFGDPTAFDFLNQAGSTTRRGERYDSLYMKFDPLAQRLSMLPQKNVPSPPAVEEVTTQKEAKEESPIHNVGTPRKNPALAAIDRLLFYSPCQPASAESAVAEAKQKKEEEVKPEPLPVPIVDEKMTKELELVRSTVLQLEEELEKQKKVHKEQIEKQKGTYEDKISRLQSQLTQEVKCKDQMSVVVEEYEKSISRLIAEREKEKTTFETEKAKLVEELQVATQHLSNTEAAFSDVHSKYERLKNIASAYKNNEAVLKESIAENQETIKTLENRYEQLKSHAMAQLEKANLELSTIRKQNETDSMKLKALVRKAELKCKSLEENVEQKIAENKELTKIIDEMIVRIE